MNSEEITYLLLFNRITNYTPKQKLQLYEKYEGAKGVLLNKRDAEECFKKPFKIDGEIVSVKKELDSAKREYEYYIKNNIFIVDINSKYYPVTLKYIYDPPVVIFAIGKLDLLNEECLLGIVGTRKASNASINIAYSVSKDLVHFKTVVVSGLATGIDFYAHKGALDGEGFTIAVLGNGIDIVYPKANENIYEKIKHRGLLITEFPLKIPPLKRNFPKRNRIISGLSLGIVIVEASESSGALITANYALEQGRDVMAFPGRASSESFAGNNKLIKDGAFLVENASDILKVLGKYFDYKKENSKLHYSPMENDILKVIGDERVSIEEIDKILESPISRISATLMMLELKGVIIQHPGKIFSRAYKHGK